MRLLCKGGIIAEFYEKYLELKPGDSLVVNHKIEVLIIEEKGE